MATLLAGTLYRVVQVMTGVAGSPYYVSAYFDQTFGTAQQAANAWRALIAPTTTGLRTGLVLSAVTEVGLFDASSGQLTGFEPVSLPALSMIGGTDPLPPATSLLLRWRTGEYVTGKEIRGRTNIPGMLETASDNGAPTPAAMTLWQDRVTAFLASTNSRHVVYSPKNSGAAVTDSGSPWSQWAVLRSRRD